MAIAVQSSISCRRPKVIEQELPTRDDARPDEIASAEDIAHFVEGVSESLSRLSAERILVVIALSVDRFSELMLARGHATGQLLLKSVANRLRERLTAMSATSLTEGDRFLIACDLSASPELLQGLRVHLASCFDEPFHIASEAMHLSASVGVAFSIGPDDDPHKLLDAAQVACAEARHRGGHQTVVFDNDARNKILDKFEMTQALHSAVQHQELSLEYQSILEIPSGAPAGFEPLLRWQPRGRDSEVAPDRFLPVAEETGLIVPIGNWMLARVLEEWSAVDQAQSPLARLPVTIRVSSAQADSGFSGLCDELIAASAALPAPLSIAITEDVLDIDAAMGWSHLTRLKENNIGLVIENFGTRVSTVSSLRAFPVDAVVIDESLTFNVHEDHRDRLILGSLIEMVHIVGALAIATRVNSQEQLDCLAHLSCDLMCNSWLSTPGPLASVVST